MEDQQEEIGTLAIGEYHPAADSAFKYVKARLKEQVNNIFILQEALASSAMSGNRLAEICGETLRRIINGEPVSDRYLLGLAWFLKEMDEREHDKRKNHTK